MSTVTGLTAARMLAIEAASVVNGTIDAFGHLILTKHDGTTIDAGYMIASVPDATTAVKGISKLASDADAVAGTDATKAVTPHALAAAISSAALPDATTSVKGKVLLASDSDATTGTDATKAVTPHALAAAITAAALPDATTSVKGKVLLASDSDATTGTDATKAITAHALTAAINAALAAAIPPGIIREYAGVVAPTGWLFIDGSSVSRTTYANLFAVCCPTMGTATMTIASPAVVTFNSHGLVAGDKIFFTTTGALPTGVSANTTYFVLSTGLTTNTFQFSATAGGTAIVSTGSQSGTHTLIRCPYGIPAGSSTNFNLPDARGRSLIGAGTATGATGATNHPLGQTTGEETHTLVTAEMPAHAHTQTVVFSSTTPLPNAFYASGFSGTNTGTGTTDISAMNQTGGGGAHNNMQPSLAVNYIIKT